MNVPLLLQACMDRKFGEIIEYENGCIYDAGFLYLSGSVNDDLLEQLSRRWHNRMLVCLSDDWENALLHRYPELIHTERHQMILKQSRLDEKLLQQFILAVPEGYRVELFSEKAFDAHPFRHGSNYKTFADFHSTGSGAVAWFGDTIVASASSFLSHKKSVELDVSSLIEHRKKGLALACCAKMILDCASRSLSVHWDAQNVASRQLAERLGYEVERSYMAYSFVAPETP